MSKKNQFGFSFALISSEYKTSKKVIKSGADSGGGGGGGGGRNLPPPPHPQGLEPLLTQRVPLWYFLRNSFLADWPDPTIF